VAPLKHFLGAAGLFLYLFCACTHMPSGAGGRGEEGPLSLAGLEMDLWTDGEMLFVWGAIGGRKTRVIFSSVELGSTLSKNCVLGKRLGRVLLSEEGEREVILLEGVELGGRRLGGTEVALGGEWKPSGVSSSRVWRIKDGWVLEKDDTQCLWVVGVAQLGTQAMELWGGRLVFREAGFVAQGEQIRFAEHPRLGIPFGQFMALIHGRKIPLRLVLETGRWASHLQRGVFSGQDVFLERLEWEALWLSLETVLPAGSFEFQDSTRHKPWADGGVGMKAFECCRLVWSPGQATATVQVFPAAPRPLSH